MGRLCSPSHQNGVAHKRRLDRAFWSRQRRDSHYEGPLVSREIGPGLLVASRIAISVCTYLLIQNTP